MLRHDAKAVALMVKAKRRRLGKTQEAFGEHVGITGQEISNIERLSRGCSPEVLIACLRSGDQWVWGVLWRSLVGQPVPWPLPRRRPARHHTPHLV